MSNVEQVARRNNHFLPSNIVRDVTPVTLHAPAPLPRSVDLCAC